MAILSGFSVAFSGSGWALVGLMGSSWGYLGAIWKQKKRQKGDRKVTEIQSTILSLFCHFSVAFSRSGWALVGLWLALVVSGWAHGDILGLVWGLLEAKKSDRKATER